MASIISERLELAKLCSAKDWSKAIRVLDSIISQSCSIQDICNRAFCYGKLELHKHVIKDCDKAIQLDPTFLHAYILKGLAFSALGRKWDAVLVWEQGYECRICQSADLKQILELEELLAIAKQEKNITSKNNPIKLLGSMSTPETETHKSSKSNETHIYYKELIDIPESHSKSNGSSVIISESIPEAIILKNFCDVAKDHKKGDCQSNGTYNLNKLNVMDQSCTDLSESSEPKSVMICNKLNGSSVPPSKSHYLSQTNDNLIDDAMKNKKSGVTKISKTNSISMNFQLSKAIGKVNEGRYDQAISILDQILKECPSYAEALIGRGTAYAFRRELDAAIADFTEAIHFNPTAAEAWKRRGQARAALGNFVEATEDLTKALKYEPDSAEIFHERGIVKFKFKDFNSAVEDLSMCVKLDKNSSAYTFLGLSFSSIGKYGMAEEAHNKSIQVDTHFFEAWIHLTQFHLDQANPTKALECLDKILKMDRGYTKAYHLRGKLFHGTGNHRNALKDLSIGLSIEKSNIELLYLRASCYHAIGEYVEAVKDYDAALGMEFDSMEKFVLQCLAFYQKEIALYTASKINHEFCWFDIDGDIDPLFKEYWCKRLHPKNVCEKVFRQPPLRDSLRKYKLKKQDFLLTKQQSTLLHAADTVGKKIQYSCRGFLHNRRQYRMAGLASIEIAQKISKFWRLLLAESKSVNKNTTKLGKKARRKDKINVPSQNRGGACCSTNSFPETSTSGGTTEESVSVRTLLSWLDVYSIAVKWRQISEPCDPVVWVNKLSDEFNVGFGSHTPIIRGQAKVIRYFPYFQRTFDITKSIIKEKACVYDKSDNIIDLSQDGKIHEIMNATSCSELNKIVGEDFWLATSCTSAAFKGKHLEGTRITLVKTKEHGLEFAIKSPCTASRWDDYDAEMTMAWDAVCSTYCGENYGSTDSNLLEKSRDAILRMTYFWYNLMPLSRGSSVVGLVIMFGLMLAANMKLGGNIPQDLQLDWEAILESDHTSFVDSVKCLLYPSMEVNTAWKGYPDVVSTFPTTASVVSALSTYDDN